MTLPDSLTRRIEAIARREGRSPEAVLESLLDDYEQRQLQHHPIEDFVGAFDDEVTDLSVTVRETLRRKFAPTDDGSA
jgi:hypothetical protein